MKKKILSILVLSIYLLGGFEITSAYIDAKGNEQV